MARPRASAMLAPLLALIGMAAVPSQPTSRREALAQKRMEATKDFEEDLNGFANLGALLSIVVVIIVAVVALGILAAVAPDYLSSIAGIVGVFTDENSTTGDPTADNIMPIFGTLVAFGGLFALIGLVFAVIVLRRGSA